MAKTKCPCCGQAVASIDPAKLAAIVSPVMAEMIEILLRHPGEFVPSEKIAQHIWRRGADGGPTNTATAICSMVNFNRRRLKALGWEVKGRMGRYGGYMLSAVEAAHD
jgi:hypothetical protein